MTNHQPPSPRWTLALTSLAFFMIALDALVVATALPAIGHDLHAGVSTLGWTVNIYSLTYAVGIITAAALGDRLGRRRVFSVCIWGAIGGMAVASGPVVGARSPLGAAAGLSLLSALAALGVARVARPARAPSLAASAAA